MTSIATSEQDNTRGGCASKKTSQRKGNYPELYFNIKHIYDNDELCGFVWISLL